DYTDSRQSVSSKQNQTKDGTQVITEIDDPNAPIHAGQVFAEMLGAVSHPEFFDHTDLEVRNLIPIQHLTIGIRDIHPSYLIAVIPLSILETVFEGLVQCWENDGGGYASYN